MLAQHSLNLPLGLAHRLRPFGDELLVKQLLVLLLALVSDHVEVFKGERFEVAHVNARHIFVPCAPIALARCPYDLGLSLRFRLIILRLSAKDHQQGAGLAL